MCGINGFNWNDKVQLKNMNDAIKHRGPDDEGVIIDENISLGHVRLSIIDLSKAGHQPMSNEDGTVWITHNGEIYNFNEIKSTLIEKGHIFTSETDTEVIIHAYEEYGFNCVNKFNGMWAFCIYDANTNILFLSRDRFGIKPLYYRFSGIKFIFSSEIKGILTHSIDINSNKTAIFDFLYYNLYDHTEETFFKDIKKLMPSNNLIFDLRTNTIQLQKYYDLEKEIKNEKCDVQKIRSLFYDSVQKTLISDVPVGSCLSGGIDSSSIVLTMNAVKPNTKIKTFSLTLQGKKNDEYIYQKQINNLINAENYFICPESSELINDIYDLICTQEEPLAGTSAYGQYRVMKLAKQNNMKVLLDGQGADEILAGYHDFFTFYYLELLKSIKIIKFIKEIKNYYSNSKSILPVIYLFLRIIPDFLKRKLYNHKKVPYLKRDFIKNYKYRIDARWHISTLNEALIKSILVYPLPHLLRFEDKNSMRFSIESRVPFLDYRFVEYILSTPADCKIHNGITKYNFREAMKHILPASIRCRYDKIGFVTPEEDWLKDGKAKKFIRSIIDSESFKNREFWDWIKVEKMYENMLNGKSSNLFVGSDIWRCISIELWMRIFIDKRKINEFKK